MKAVTLLLAATVLAQAAYSKNYCPTPVLDPSLDPSKAVPQMNLPTVGGTAIGLLAGDMADVIKLEGRFTSERQALLFSADGSSYRYVRLKGPGEQVLATPANVAQWNIKDKFSLVEVEVNDGRGEPEGSEFIDATKLTQLDGTPSYPLSVQKAVVLYSACADAYIGQLSSLLNSAMLQSQVHALGLRKPTGPEERSTLLLPTWLTKEEKLEVRVLTSRTNGDYAYGCGIVPVGGECHGGARYGTQYGIQMELVYQIDKTGSLTKVTKSPIKELKHELPPPPRSNGKVTELGHEGIRRPSASRP